MASRISKKFASAQAQGRGILGVFVSAGDPNEEICVATLDALVEAGADMIELGMPFSDPMADGPAIQAASLRAIAAGMNLEKTLKIAADFRDRHPDIPLILMGYFNPIYIYGRDAFIKAAVSAGVDGLIIVDLPPEEDVELCDPARQAGLDFIRLTTPTTKGARLTRVLEKAGGSVYYVSITGITGTKSAAADSIQNAVNTIKGATSLPVVTGFGIRTPEQAAEAATMGDGAIVGSAVVEIIANNIAEDGTPSADIPQKIGQYVSTLANAIAAK